MNLRFSLGCVAKVGKWHNLLSISHYLNSARILNHYDCLQKTLTGEILMDVKVNPGVKQSGIIGYDQWTKCVKIAVTAKAEAGRANNAVLHVLSEQLKIPKHDLIIVGGQRSRSKKIMISNHGIQRIKKSLTEALA